MKLGLVCKRFGQSDKKGFSGIKAVQKATSQQIYTKCLGATLSNLSNAYENILYCAKNDISAYRISSDIVPFAEFWDWENNDTLSRLFAKVKHTAEHHNITLIIHPDQFTVLSSPKLQVVENSISILKHHHKLAQVLGIKHIILHLGGVYGDKDLAMYRFVDNYLDLSDELRGLIVLENCHYYSANEVKLISDLIGIRLCYDLHHQNVCTGAHLTAEQHKLNIARLQPSLCHVSSGKANPCDKSHADYISASDAKLYRDVFTEYPNIIVEVEAKAKDLAIKKLLTGAK